MTPDPIATIGDRARALADREARAERDALARLLSDPAMWLVVLRLEVTDLAVAATLGRIAAGPLLRMLTAAADLATQARAMTPGPA